LKKLSLISFLLLISLNSVFAFDFSIDNKNYTYNPDELKFYIKDKNKSTKLTKEQVSELFPDYKIVLVSQFNDKRKYNIKNSLFKTQKILILNDTSRTFHLFDIYPVTSRNEFQNSYDIKSLITIYGKKNVRLKHEGGDQFIINVK